MIFDAHFNSLNTIILGTLSKSILMFCYNESEGKYELKRDVSFKHSVIGLLTSNLTMNCANDLVILTLNGIHIWQYEPEYVINLINTRLNQNEAAFDNYLEFLKKNN